MARGGGTPGAYALGFRFVVMARFLATVSYVLKGHEVLVEVWLENERPEGATDREEVEEILRQVATTGIVPEGWTVTALNWSHPRSGKSGMDSAKLEAFDGIIRSTPDITIEENPRKPPRTLEGGEP